MVNENKGLYSIGALSFCSASAQKTFHFLFLHLGAKYNMWSRMSLSISLAQHKKNSFFHFHFPIPGFV